MAVTANHLTSSGSETAQSSYNTASVSPGSNRLILVAVLQGRSGGGNVPTLSGNGLTWQLVASSALFTSFYKMHLFRSMGASPSTGAITIDFGGQNQTRVTWSVVEFDGVDTGGTDGSAAVVQSASNTGTAVTSLTVTLAAFGSADNATYGTFGTDQVGDITPGTGFTELSDVSHGQRHETEWRSDNDTSVDVSWSGSSDAGGIAVEIKAFSAATPPLNDGEGMLQTMQNLMGGLS